jgi:hypothetical protein
MGAAEKVDPRDARIAELEQALREMIAGVEALGQRNEQMPLAQACTRARKLFA